MTTPSQQVASEQFANFSRWPSSYRSPTNDEWLQEVQQLKRDLAAAQEARQRAEEALVIVQHDCRSLTEKVIPAIEERAQRAEARAEQTKKLTLASVEQRIRSWRQSTMNKSGDRLALDDFMGKDLIDDLIDYVCDEYAAIAREGK